MSSKSDPPITLNLLTLLHQYTSLHSEATSNQKSFYWNLTKARQKRGFQAGGGGFGGSEYSANDVREELRAQAVLEFNDEPDLLEEDEPLELGSEGKFILHFDGGKAMRSKFNREEKLDSIEADGLRRRGNVSDAGVKSESEKWTEEVGVDQDEQLRSADPLTLFGVPPPALREAQVRSRDAVAYYVEVANLAMEIVRITNGQGSDRK